MGAVDPVCDPVGEVCDPWGLWLQALGSVLRVVGGAVQGDLGRVCWCPTMGAANGLGPRGRVREREPGWGLTAAAGTPPPVCGPVG